MKIGIRTKIALGVFGLLILTLTSVDVFVGKTIRQHFEREFLKRAVFSGFGIVERVHPILHREDVAAVRMVLIRYQKERPDVSYYICAHSGQVYNRHSGSSTGCLSHSIGIADRFI